MIKIKGHVLTEDVVVNYKDRDRDDCLHFLTHLDTSCPDLASIISPTAKKIYTSTFNAWCLKMNYNVKNIDIQGFDTNKSYKITFKGNKYIYSFIDAKFSADSVALILHGKFGCYLYTGNFSYYSAFVKSPVLLPVIEEKALTRLYLDNTYYERSSDFYGFDEIVSRVVKLIKSEPMKFFYIYAVKVTMDPLIAEIASKLEEPVYVCQSTMQIIKMLGYEAFFTRYPYRSRIFINKTIIKSKEFEQNNITVYLNRFSDSCKSFQKIEKKGNVYNFNVYCHSTHRELCELLGILKPETMTFLYSEIDRTKLSYNFEFEYDLPSNVTMKGASTKPSIINFEGSTNEVVKKIPGQLILSNVINDNIAEASSSDFGCKKNISKNQELLNLKVNNSGIHLAHSSSGNPYTFNVHNTEYRCPLRIRKVPEINNAELCKKTNYAEEDDDNNLTSINEISYNSNEINHSDKKSFNADVQSHSSLEGFHSYQKPEPKHSLKVIKVLNNNSTVNALIPSNVKTLSPCVVPTQTGLPLVFNPKLVKDNGLNNGNSKIMEISNIRMLSNGKKNTIVVKRKYVDVKKPCLITVPRTQYTKVNNCLHSVLLKSKACDTDSNIKEPSVLDCSKIVNSSMIINQASDSDSNIKETSVLDSSKIVHGSMIINPASDTDSNIKETSVLDSSKIVHGSMIINPASDTDSNIKETSVLDSSKIVHGSMIINPASDTDSNIKETSVLDSSKIVHGSMIINPASDTDSNIKETSVLDSSKIVHGSMIINPASDTDSNIKETSVLDCSKIVNRSMIINQASDSDSNIKETSVLDSSKIVHGSMIINPASDTDSNIKEPSVLDFSKIVNSSMIINQASDSDSNIKETSVLDSSKIVHGSMIINPASDTDSNIKETSVLDSSKIVHGSMIINPASDTDSNIKETSVLDSSKIVHGSMIINPAYASNNSLKTNDNSESEESISSESEINARENSQLNASINNIVDEDFIRLQSSQQTCNETNSENESNLTNIQKSVEDIIETSSSTCRIIDNLEAPNENEFCTNYSLNSPKDSRNINLKRCSTDVDNWQSNKKLRSENLRQSLSLSILPQKEPFLLRHCSVLIRRNNFERTYFFSSKHDCYLPKFIGFKKNEVRPRTTLIALRNLQNLLKN